MKRELMNYITPIAVTAILMGTTAVADMSLKGTGRIGVQIKDGTAAVAPTEGAYTAAQITALDTAVGTWAADLTAGAATNDSTAVTLLTELRADRAAAVTAYGLISGPTAAETASYATAIAAWDSAIDAADGTVGTAATKSTTSAVNRIRITFSGSGQTDNGLSYGATIRADQAAAGNTGTLGTQWVEGAFGRVTMGDVDGADEWAVGDVDGVGLAGLGFHNEMTYQSAEHDLGWSLEAQGLTVGASMDTSVTSGSNMAYGASYTVAVEGVGVTAGVGKSDVGTASQTSMGVSATMAGLSATLIHSADDNGTAADVDETALSVSYSMAAITATVFQKDVATTGAADTNYQGVGIAYDLGGATAKLGVMRDDADLQTIDAGISFSF